MDANNKAMREALVEIDELTNLLDIPEAKDKKNLLFAPSHSFVAVKMRKIIKKALEEPARNCDVGTSQDQNDRFNLYCDEHGRYCDGSSKCNDCPLLKQMMTNGGKCEFMWVQMPYETPVEKDETR